MDCLPSKFFFSQRASCITWWHVPWKIKINFINFSLLIQQEDRLVKSMPKLTHVCCIFRPGKGCGKKIPKKLLHRKILKFLQDFWCSFLCYSFIGVRWIWQKFIKGRFFGVQFFGGQFMGSMKRAFSTLLNLRYWTYVIGTYHSSNETIVAGPL